MREPYSTSGRTFFGSNLLAGLSLALAVMGGHAAAPAKLELAGDWRVRVTMIEPHTRTKTLNVAPPAMVSVAAERLDSLPVFNPNTGGWAKGAQLRGVRAQETTTPHLLDPASLVLRTAPGPDYPILRRGQDYEADLIWGTVGRCAGGAIKEGQPVYASYRYAPLRIDAVVLTRGGRIVLRQGEPRPSAPLPPALKPGEHRLANIWLPGQLSRLGPENLFPVLETAYPEPPKPSPAPADQLLPGTMSKLRSGEHLRILAWGDSVTVGTYVPDWPQNRWQEQFVARLKAQFPKANIELLTEAWGGRNTASYLAEPSGSPHNYRERVLGARPDLIVSEFVNDAGLSLDQVKERYSNLLADFRGIGAEWIILTPHYVRPDWMGLKNERDVDKDPRPYVAGLRDFAARNHVALADASLRYGRLWRQGIPCSTLLLNSINHPGERGMTIFADALMELFPSPGVRVVVLDGGDSRTRPEDCRAVLVGPGVNQPDPFPGYGGFVGWESPVRLKNGDWLVGFNAGYWHASAPTPLRYPAGTLEEYLKLGLPRGVVAPTGGRAMVIRSTDQGKTWSKPVTLIDTPADDRHPAFVELGDGTLLCSFFTYMGVPEESEREDPSLATRVRFIRSFDGGHTWEKKPRLPGSPFASDETDGPLVKLKDGSVVVALDGRPRTGPPAQAAVLRSTNRGRTWRLLGTIQASHELEEVTVAELPGGEWVMMARPEGDICWSRDRGRTWTTPMTFGMRMFAPSLYVLRDGTLVCLHGSYVRGGLRLIFSRDGGHAWMAAGKNYGFLVDQSYGYGKAMELPDGSLFVTYLATGGHRTSDAQTNAIRCIRLRVRPDYSGIDLLPAPNR